jgi:hypothetical protein
MLANNSRTALSSEKAEMLTVDRADARFLLAELPPLCFKW